MLSPRAPCQTSLLAHGDYASNAFQLLEKVEGKRV